MRARVRCVRTCGHDDPQVGGEVADRILKETFDKIDLDGGGTLDKDEIMEAAWILKGDIGADDMTEEQFAVIIGQLDEDGDGEVDMEVGGCR